MPRYASKAGACNAMLPKAQSLLDTQLKLGVPYEIIEWVLEAIKEKEVETVKSIPVKDLPLHVSDSYYSAQAQELLKDRLLHMGETL